MRVRECCLSGFTYRQNAARLPQSSSCDRKWAVKQPRAHFLYLGFIGISIARFQLVSFRSYGVAPCIFLNQ